MEAEVSLLTICLIVYVLGIIVTWCYAGYVTGVQFTQNVRAARRVGQNPGFAINYTNVFFQGLCWFSFWASMIGETTDKQKNGDPMDIEIPQQQRRL
jgi:hypothetical protein